MYIELEPRPWCTAGDSSPKLDQPHKTDRMKHKKYYGLFQLPLVTKHCTILIFFGAKVAWKFLSWKYFMISFLFYLTLELFTEGQRCSNNISLSVQVFNVSIYFLVEKWFFLDFNLKGFNAGMKKRMEKSAIRLKFSLSVIVLTFHSSNNLF